jgi:hypothetical protein
MKRLMVILAATVVGVCATSAGNNLTTCDQFRERLTRADKLFGADVPRFEFRDVNAAVDSGNHTYEIENDRGLTGELACNLKTDAVSWVDVRVAASDVEDNAKGRFNASARFMVSMFAMTWAYTNWTQPKVQAAVKKMISEAHAELELSEMRGDKIALGKGTIDINDNVDVAYTIGSPGLGYMINSSAVSAKSAERKD